MQDAFFLFLRFGLPSASPAAAADPAFLHMPPPDRLDAEFIESLP